MKINHYSTTPDQINWSIDAPVIASSFRYTLRNRLSQSWDIQLSSRPYYFSITERASPNSVMHVSSTCAGTINAQVKNRKGAPYAVTISMPALSLETFNTLIEDVIYSFDELNQLLQGNYYLFDARIRAKCPFTLNPLDERLNTVTTTCTCQKQTMFCMHAIATFCILVQVLSNDPMMYFSFCGISIEQIHEVIKRKHTQLMKALEERCRVDQEFCTKFWGHDNTAISTMKKEIAPPKTDAATLLKLGKMPVMINKKNSEVFFQEIYGLASAYAIKAMQEENAQE